jgi:hypothetical protein
MAGIRDCNHPMSLWFGRNREYIYSRLGCARVSVIPVVGIEGGVARSRSAAIVLCKLCHRQELKTIVHLQI